MNKKKRVYKKKESKFIRSLKFIGKWGYKICIAAAGTAAIYSNPVTGGVAGAIAISSAISAAVKDKKLSKLMPLINIIAGNVGKAANDPKKNK